MWNRSKSEVSFSTWTTCYYSLLGSHFQTNEEYPQILQTLLQKFNENDWHLSYKLTWREINCRTLDVTMTYWVFLGIQKRFACTVRKELRSCLYFANNLEQWDIFETEADLKCIFCTWNILLLFSIG